MDPKTYKFDTLSLHAGYQPKKNAGSRQVPIYQTTSYLFDDVDQRFTENPHELDEFDPKDKSNIEND